MKRLDLVLRVRSYTRDFSNSIFRETDIIDYINESINRFRQVIPELKNMIILDNKDSVPILLPEQYHHLLALYSASRCFSQDERYYQATTLMNEFEVKLEELKSEIEAGNIVITDGNGIVVTVDNDVDYVDLSPYWSTTSADLDEGVEGVE